MTEILAGIAGPLTAAVVSCVLAQRVYRRSHQALTSMMITAFAAKMVFFAGYVAVLIKGAGLQPVPFATSLIASFIVLHMAEAYFLNRLFSEGSR